MVQLLRCVWLPRKSRRIWNPDLSLFKSTTKQQRSVQNSQTSPFPSHYLLFLGNQTEGNVNHQFPNATPPDQTRKKWEKTKENLPVRTLTSQKSGTNFQEQKKKKGEKSAQAKNEGLLRHFWSANSSFQSLLLGLAISFLALLLLFPFSFSFFFLYFLNLVSLSKKAKNREAQKNVGIRASDWLGGRELANRDLIIYGTQLASWTSRFSFEVPRPQDFSRLIYAFALPLPFSLPRIS